ncbi:MAG TPA: gamma-glutamyl-gamma-aminobutyrate hydrolase family protein [Acidimicrobiales bacterium]|nr:gamma-glutamyl-gamma-aminobutyrate hydrolase family protein [Acidimicrobiales bacterium]
MPARPLVAVAANRLAPGRVSSWTDGAEAGPERYLSALRRAGVLPVVTGGAPDDVDELLGGGAFAGLVLLGGADVDPAAYGQGPHPTTYGTDPARDAFELAAARGAVATGLPLLAVCRGVQVLNVAMGGTLHQHLPEAGSTIAHGVPVGTGAPAVHAVAVEPGSRLAQVEAAGGPLERCVSIHHQGLATIGAGLVVTGRAADGVVEAVETPADAPGWCLGVQWHPERSAVDDPAQQAVFDAFAAAARAHAAARHATAGHGAAGPVGAGVATR